MNFTWKPFFHELFLKIVNEYDAKSLATLIYELFPENAMMDTDKDNKKVRFKEFEPCSFIARFNRSETLSKRIEYCEKAKKILALKSAVPKDFDGIPIFNPMRWMLFPFTRESKGFEIKVLWKFAKEIASGSITESGLNDSSKSFGAGLTYLTTVAYIVNPERYLPTDTKTKEYLQKRDSQFLDIIESIKKSEEPFRLYQDFLKNVSAAYPNKSFAEISKDAHLEAIGELGSELSMNSQTEGVHYWSISAGEGAQYWGDWQEDNLISIGWNELGDLSKIEKYDDVAALYREKYKSQGSSMNNILANFEFAHRLKKDDIVFVKNGRKALYGVGRVTSDYRFDKSEKQSHVRDVEWLSVGNWKLEQVGTFALKTLTDITEYDQFVEGLLKLSGLSDSEAVGGLVEKAKNVTLSKNTIFWGPPGTGKTFTLIEHQKSFTDITSVSDRVFTWVQDLGWWEVIAAALIDIDKPVLVPDLFNHEFIQAKAKQSSNKTPKNTIWGLLQAHTVKESETVGFEKRQEPLVVDKLTDSRWQLVGNWKDQLEDLVEDVKNIRKPSSDSLSQRFEMVTFHQSYSYEEFVEGIRPEVSADGSGVSYQVKDGIFKRICQRASENSDRNYAIFIDEINRGNISKIFGELITLIEEDKRVGAPHEVEITLPYSGQKFGVPSNLYIIGTMNSVDRSIALVDMALRRRFDFVAIRPNSSLISDDVIKEFSVRRIFEKLNDKIAVLLGSEYQIGHSYFMGKNANSIASLKKTWFGSVLPLLQEYLFDDWDKLTALVGDFVKDTSVDGLDKLSLPKTSYGSFVDIRISDNDFVSLMKKLAE